MNDTKPKTNTLDRRNFLRISTLASGGLLIAIALPEKVVAHSVTPPTLNTASMNAFLRIGSDNSIHVILSKVEMGQGIWTTLPMLIAEELDCDLTKIWVEASPPGKAADFIGNLAYQSTGGSESTVQEFDRFRQAGATARMMLLTVAAKKMGVLPDECRTENGYVIAGTRCISYGEVATEASTLPVPVVKLKAPKDWKYIGKSQKRLDTPEKIMGKAVYGLDIHFPGLLTAVVAHPPIFGATVKSFQAAKVTAIKVVRQVLAVPTGVAVIADSFWAAKKGRDALQIEWNLGLTATLDSKKQREEYHRLAQSAGIPFANKGDVTTALTQATEQFEAVFDFPYLAHAPMEPLNCTVQILPNACEVWTGTQSPLLHQAEIATYLGLRPEQVQLHTPRLGGSFGRRGSFNSDWVMEAVQIAKLSGKAIKLVWTREDDIQGGYYRPMYTHYARIGIGADGLPNAWLHRIVGQSLFTNTPLADMIVQKGIDYSSVTKGGPYTDNIPDYSFELHTTQVGVPVLPWRSVGATHTAFVVETLIDELAYRAGKDPVYYRRAFLKNAPRHLAALDLAVEKTGWHQPLPNGVYRGVAVCEAMGSYVAQVVEASVNAGQVRVHRVVCAIDCGLAVNPDGVVAQMEGGIVYGLTAALYGEITFAEGRVQQSNFHDYRMLRINEMPVIEVHIVPSSERMGGAGEPGVAPIAPALANALFAATGKRIRSLPLRVG